MERREGRRNSCERGTFHSTSGSLLFSQPTSPVSAEECEHSVCGVKITPIMIAILRMIGIWDAVPVPAVAGIKQPDQSSNRIMVATNTSTSAPAPAPGVTGRGEKKVLREIKMGKKPGIPKPLASPAIAFLFLSIAHRGPSLGRHADVCYAIRSLPRLCGVVYIETRSLSVSPEHRYISFFSAIQAHSWPGIGDFIGNLTYLPFNHLQSAVDAASR